MFLSIWDKKEAVMDLYDGHKKAPDFFRGG